MVVGENLVIQRPLFQFITAFSSFNLGKIVWDQYQKFAVPTIENATISLEQAVNLIPTFTPAEASSQKATIEVLTSSIKPLREFIENENDEEFAQFKNASLAFFYILEQIEKELDKAANQEDATRAVFHHMTRSRKNPAFGKYIK
jgi:hypothetical protein